MKKGDWLILDGNDVQLAEDSVPATATFENEEIEGDFARCTNGRNVFKCKEFTVLFDWDLESI